ncbi:MAG: M17 family peptidase N-terminal domain-containing protein, partial [Vicinamibacterales bacterium]
MSSAYQLPRLTSSTASALDVPADLVALPLLEGESGVRVDAFDAATGGELGAAMARGAFAAKAGELLSLPLTGTAGGARRLLAIGLGPAGELSVERCRRAAASAVSAARKDRY